MTTNEAAESLGVTPQRIVAMIHEGQVAATKHGRDWWISQEAVAALSERPGPGRPRKDEEND